MPFKRGQAVTRSVSRLLRSLGIVLCVKQSVAALELCREYGSMRRGALLLSLLLLMSACTNGQTAGPTTTLTPIEGDPRYPTTIRTSTTVAATTTTSTTLIGHVDPAKEMTDEQLTKLAIAVFQAHMRGFGSEDPVLAEHAEKLAMDNRLAQTLAANERLQRDGIGFRGELEVHSPVRPKFTTNREYVVLNLCVRDNRNLTDIRTGANVDPTPLPRPIKKVAVGVRRDGSQWKVQIYGTPQDGYQCSAE